LSVEYFSDFISSQVFWGDFFALFFGFFPAWSRFVCGRAYLCVRACVRDVSGNGELGLTSNFKVEPWFCCCWRRRGFLGERDFDWELGVGGKLGFGRGEVRKLCEVGKEKEALSPR
jgi:hypothetical protein